MGNLLSGLSDLPDEIIDFLISLKDLVENIVSALKIVVDHLPDLVKAILGLFEDILLMVGIVSKSARFVVFVLPAVSIYLFLQTIINDLDL